LLAAGERSGKTRTRTRTSTRTIEEKDGGGGRTYCGKLEDLRLI
jgi:hypothetical protein